jgi:hypothetical protein
MVRALLLVSLCLLSPLLSSAAPISNKPGNSGGSGGSYGQQIPPAAPGTQTRYTYQPCRDAYERESKRLLAEEASCKELCVGALRSTCMQSCVANFVQRLNPLGDSLKRCMCAVYVENTLLSWLESDPRFRSATAEQWNQQRKFLIDQCIKRPPEFR